MKIEIAPNIAVLGFTLYKIANPKMVKTHPKIKAFCLEILPEGNGRFLVRSILASNSISMI